MTSSGNLPIMRTAFRRVTRALLGLLLASAMALAVTEQLAPELHDRDAGVSVHVDVPSDRHQGDPLSGHSANIAHLCHCSHFHAGTSPTREGRRLARSTSSLARPRNDVAPRSANRDSILRPPIA